ncbi:short-chain dehydrogenase [Bordetella trematum]|nr:SDR family oxidoreductase [Bordetella trematum]AZR94823.1 short-chain dehydrogenase [Bordetella trematum]NNH20138.1 SDR family oxidoreductase [Bordetella trematum]SAH94434.1 oxidoreductase%2C short-chain dehydrogenase/reductase [Bordetella trematum]SUV96904.1 oxidoreductase, short-chain dehydrogenase/reductase [Bordetella trematum]
MFETDLYRGQRVLVTGGGTGLGFAMAGKLASLGAEVHLWGRREAVLHEAAAALRETHGAQVFTHALDIRDAAAVARQVDHIWQQHGPLTALINNAAGNFVSRTEDLSINGFHAISDIVFRGTFYVTQAVGRQWIAQGLPGAVLSIVVTWVDTGAPFVVPSAMSKAGLDAMTKSLAVEWGPKGIRLNAIAPGVIPTEGASQRLRPGIEGNRDSARQRELDNPMRRLGTGEDIGNLAAFMLAPGNTWLNGQTITLDGGDALANGAYFTDYQAWTDDDWALAKAMAKGAR